MNEVGGKHEKDYAHRMRLLDSAHVGGVWRKDVSKDRCDAEFELKCCGVS